MIEASWTLFSSLFRCAGSPLFQKHGVPHRNIFTMLHIFIWQRTKCCSDLQGVPLLPRSSGLEPTVRWRVLFGGAGIYPAATRQSAGTSQATAGLPRVPAGEHSDPPPPGAQRAVQALHRGVHTPAGGGHGGHEDHQPADPHGGGVPPGLPWWEVPERDLLQQDGGGHAEGL